MIGMPPLLDVHAMVGDFHVPLARVLRAGVSNVGLRRGSSWLGDSRGNPPALVYLGLSNDNIETTS